MAKPVESTLAVKLISSAGNLLTMTYDTKSGDVFRVVKTPLEVADMVDTGYEYPKPNEFHICQLLGYNAVSDGVDGSVIAQGFMVLGKLKVPDDHEFALKPFPAHEMVKRVKEENVFVEFFAETIGSVAKHFAKPSTVEK